ncbi:hypothetical protein [Natrinema hispanicum]|uniref:Uncharacterized protein n=1 Tax=Natrinema hispanicum TaxID=392421 RepID=A0A1G6ZMR3_9EURY|nr:hypothetical protein [Natrinema hispanicum]SDE03958.1 hypothetical protein SAMN05192552_11122 [Natrinema hispanicum]SEU15021.1 hypothetical protein SAMN04488694_1734 [Natrinema hispanicum]
MSDRRSFLKGVGIASIPLLSGTALAASSKSAAEEGVWSFDLENGKLVADQNSASALDTHSSNGNAVQIDRETASDVTAELNELESRGFVEFRKAGKSEPGNVLVTPTDRIGELYPSYDTDSDVGIASSHCGSGGKNDFEAKLISVPPKYNFYIDDQATSELVEIAIYGAGATAALTFLLTITGAGSVPAAVTGLISSLLGTSAALLSNENEGDGVIIRVNYIPPSGTWAEVDSQCHPDGGIPW